MKHRTLLLVILGLAVLFAWRSYYSDKDREPGEIKPEDARPNRAVLERGNGPEPEAVNPQHARTDAAFNIARDLFEGLTTHDPGGAIIPGVAESWVISDDGRVYTFTLRESARWSNGDRVTASDFVSSFRRLVDPATGAYYAASLSPVENADRIIAGEMGPEALGVQAPDDGTLVVRLNAPTPYFLDLASHPSLFPVHIASINKLGADYSKPGKLVSNGAFVLTEWVVGSHVAAKRNTHYWGNENNAIDYVYFLNTAEPASEFNRYRAGELDFTETIPLAQYRMIKETLGKELHIAPYLTTYYYGFNLRGPPFDDNPALRQALSMAVDREVVTEKITGTGELPAYGWVPPGTNYYRLQTFSWANMKPEARIAEAQRLYREAGYSRENPLRFELRYNTSETHQRIAVAVAAMWKEHLGAEVTLANEEFRVLIQNIREGRDIEMFRSSWVGDYNDAYSFLVFFQSDFGLNLVGYDNPDYDALLLQAQSVTDMKARRGYLEGAERLMLADNPVIPIYFQVSRHLVKPHVKGWRDNIMNIHLSRHLRVE